MLPWWGWVLLWGVLVVGGAARAADFHASLANLILEQARTVYRDRPFSRVGLTGGVFQNRFLCERIAALLEAQAIPVMQHRLVPANDGGLAFGQIIEYMQLDPDNAID